MFNLFVSLIHDFDIFGDRGGAVHGIAGNGVDGFFLFFMCQLFSNFYVILR